MSCKTFLDLAFPNFLYELSNVWKVLRPLWNLINGIWKVRYSNETFDKKVDSTEYVIEHGKRPEGLVDS